MLLFFLHMDNPTFYVDSQPSRGMQTRGTSPSATPDFSRAGARFYHLPGARSNPGRVCVCEMSNIEVDETQLSSASLEVLTAKERRFVSIRAAGIFRC